MTNFDLANLDALTENQDAGIPLAVRHPVTQEPMGWTIRVAGVDSERVKKVLKRQRNSRLKNAQRQLTADLLDAQNREVLVACVISWSFDEDVSINGEQPECTPEKADQLIRRWPWLGAQIEERAQDTAAFLES